MERKKIDISLPPELRDDVVTIQETLRQAGHECYLVGGSVRDLILEDFVGDVDFATSAQPKHVMSLFSRVVPTGIRHGTVTVLMGDQSYEITTYRSEGTYVDGRRPENVFFSDTLEEDVIRRDFTINGLAYDIESGEVIDYVGGLRDLEDGIIRTIGDPMERFTEDGLRPIRACRFSARLGFKIDEDTFKAIPRTLDVTRRVSVERIRDEFMKLLQSDQPSVGIENLRVSGLLEIFMPELADTYGVEQNRFHVFDVYYHSIHACDAAPADYPLIRLAALLHDIGKVPTRQMGEDGDYTFYNHEVVGARMVKRIMKRMKFSNEDINRVNNLVLNHMFHYKDEWTDGAVRRFMRKVGVDNIDDLFSLRIADRTGNGSREGMPVPMKKLQKRIEKIIEEENAITVRDLDIDGNTVMRECNLSPGPMVGRVLHELLERVLDDPSINENDKLVPLAREICSGLKEERGEF
jgi:poly(A) polymerase/tRNA nucleotidyltransferase (CCA-adding enzyme)